MLHATSALLALLLTGGGAYSASLHQGILAMTVPSDPQTPVFKPCEGAAARDADADDSLPSLPELAPVTPASSLPECDRFSAPVRRGALLGAAFGALLGLLVGAMVGAVFGGVLRSLP